MTFAVREQNCLCPLAIEMLEVFLNRVLSQEQVIRDIMCFKLLLAKVFSSAPDCLLPFFVLFLRWFPIYFSFAAVCLILWICFSFFVWTAWAIAVDCKVLHFLNNSIWFLFKNLIRSKLAFWTLKLLIRSYFSESESIFFHSAKLDVFMRWVYSGFGASFFFFFPILFREGRLVFLTEFWLTC